MKNTLTKSQMQRLRELGVETEKDSLNIVDLFDMMPKIHGMPMCYEGGPYPYVAFEDMIHEAGSDEDRSEVFADEELIDALYSALVWCIEEGYKPFEIK